MSELSELSEYKRGSDHFQRPIVGNVGIHEGFVSVLAQQTHGVVSIYVGIVGVVGIDEGFRPFSSFIIQCRKVGIHVIFVAVPAHKARIMRYIHEFGHIWACCLPFEREWTHQGQVAQWGGAPRPNAFKFE